MPWLLDNGVHLKFSCSLGEPGSVHVSASYAGTDTGGVNACLYPAKEDVELGRSMERPMPQETIRFEDFELDPGSFQLRRTGQTVKLERIPLQRILNVPTLSAPSLTEWGRK